ncbi:MAG: acylphosphatase [Candidatus Pacearchaeota archaeon]|nr:acylphosphatase [Candidatus Pacearchaeota archaeon]
MRKALKIQITGPIQPLFFKRFIKDKADKLNIRGFVRELPTIGIDKKIEIFIEGDEPDVNTMAEICKIGPSQSTMRKIEEKIEQFQNFLDFKILAN